MKLLLSFCLLFSLALSVNQPPSSVPITARLIAKYQVLDEVLSPQHTKCSGEIKEFLKAGPYDCSFKVQGLEFDIEYKYVADAKGNLQEFWPYLPEGPDVLTIAELRKDGRSLKYHKLENFHLALSPDRISVLDGRQQVFIERIYPAEKLILARKDAHTSKGRRFIYQYQ
ncbi:MAG TPA: hypothetical protein VFO93_12880 [Hymenobacter sp.]|uniref:hypothetical protein n=1 Tax=Hymenobacter sp. TaxID=1898978 RepID=UPI002D7F090A|nr:hypothetical protein [Hymenobacter sp.]HET9504429.1 hypothetical protein [Hymenobacter sp.]